MAHRLSSMRTGFLGLRSALCTVRRSGGPRLRAGRATTGLPIFTRWELTPEKYDALRAQCSSHTRPGYRVTRLMSHPHYSEYLRQDDRSYHCSIPYLTCVDSTFVVVRLHIERNHKTRRTSLAAVRPVAGRRTLALCSRPARIHAIELGARVVTPRYFFASAAL